MKSAGSWHTPITSLRAGSSGSTPVREGGRRPGAPGPSRVGRPEETPLLGGPRSAALPSRAGPPGHLSPSRGWGQSSVPALAEVASGLTLFPKPASTQGKEALRRGQHRPPASKEGRRRAPGSNRETSSFPDKGLLGAPAAFRGMRTAEPERLVRPGLPKCWRGRGAAPGTCAPRRRPRPPPLARPPPPAPLPGFSPASAEEVAEESVRTLGSLCERPRDTRQPLPSSDAAMGPAGAGASWREPRGIRASEAAKVTAEGAGGGVFLKSKIKKAREREGAGGPRRGRFRAVRQ